MSFRKMRKRMEKRNLESVEPHYQSLSDLKANRHIPDDIRELIYERHIIQRNQIGQILGEIELAYRRGFQAGQEAARAAGEETDGG